MTAGFYKKQGEEWIYAPNYVEAEEYVLIASEKDSYEYPVDGWVWLVDPPTDLITPDSTSMTPSVALEDDLDIIVQTSSSPTSSGIMTPDNYYIDYGEADSSSLKLGF